MAGELEPRLIADADYDRRKFIGSSNVAAIMGYSPAIAGRQDTAYDVWRAKTSDTPEEMDPDLKLFLERRRRLEPYVMAMLREEFDAEIVAANRRYVDPEVPYFATEIDFEWRDPVDGLVKNGEIKTVSPRAYNERFGWGEPGTGDVPVHYECQVVFGQGVTRRPGPSILVAAVGWDQMEFYVIQKDQDMIDRVREECGWFWEHYVLTGKPPPAQTIADLNKMWAKPRKPPMAVDATGELGSKALRLRAMRAQMEALEADQDVLEFEVKLAMKDAEELYVDGGKVVSWTEQRWSRLDQSAIKEHEKEVYKKYLKTGTHRKFNILKGR